MSLDPRAIQELKKESRKSKRLRRLLNIFPAYFFSGCRCLYIADDFSEARIRIKLNWMNKNYVGTLFGGSLYAAIDPIYMLLFIQLLGSPYIVWDKSAKIDFIKPGKSCLYAHFIIDPTWLEKIKAETEKAGKYIADFPVVLKDKNGVIHAKAIKTLYFRKKA